MAVPVFTNEVLSALNGSFEPQYKIVDKGGNIVSEAATLELLNNIAARGTPHNADVMNNLVDMGNPASFPNAVQTITFPEGKALTEWRSSGGALIASNETDFTTMTETQKLYSENGLVIQQRVIRYFFENEEIRTEVGI